MSRMTPLWSASRVCDTASDDKRRERSTARLIDATPSHGNRSHERRESIRFFPASSPSFLSRITRKWHCEDPSIAFLREITVRPDRKSVNCHPGMSIDRGFILPWAETDVEFHFTSTGQKPSQDQRSDQTGIQPPKPPTPLPRCPCGRQVEPRNWKVAPSSTAGGDGLDDQGHRNRSHLLRLSSEPQSAQKKNDVDRFESGCLIRQCCWLLRHMVAHSHRFIRAPVSIANDDIHTQAAF